MSKAVMQQGLEALEIGYDSAKAEADQFHSAMAGYKPQRHAQMDADVQTIAKAITALRAALAEPEQEPDGISWLKRDSGYFTAPTPRRPVELTNQEIPAVWAKTFEMGSSANTFARAVIAAYEAKQGEPA